MKWQASSWNLMALRVKYDSNILFWLVSKIHQHNSNNKITRVVNSQLDIINFKLYSQVSMFFGLLSHIWTLLSLVTWIWAWQYISTYIPENNSCYFSFWTKWVLIQTAGSVRLTHSKSLKFRVNYYLVCRFCQI